MQSNDDIDFILSQFSRRIATLEKNFIELEDTVMKNRYGEVQCVPEGEELKMTEMKGGTRINGNGNRKKSN